MINVNGKNENCIKLISKDEIIREYSLELDLKRGENEILLYAEKNMELYYFVDFDKVSLELISEGGINWLLIIAISSTVAVLAVAAFVYIRRKKDTIATNEETTE